MMRRLARPTCAVGAQRRRGIDVQPRRRDLFLAAQASATLELTPSNWEQRIGDKAAFVKFLAPW